MDIQDKPTIKNGIFYIDGTPQFFISGDYPYYRDDPSVWEDRLQKMKEGGIQIVTFYTPWRLHLVKFGSDGQQEFDFTGKTYPNTNVVQFLSLIKKLGLFACVKPGPFIHAETDYGGLPDCVNPDENPKIEPQLNYLAQKGYREPAKNRWISYSGKPLPSPVNPEFLRLGKEFYSRVGKEVVEPFLYPEGPVVLLQFLNEGLFSSGQMPYAYSGDYTRTNREIFQNFLQERYRTISEYNSIHATDYTSFRQIAPPGVLGVTDDYDTYRDFLQVVDWNDYGIRYYANRVNELKLALTGSFSPANLQKFPPLIANWNPQSDFGQGFDIWATRVNVEEIQKLTDVHYGYTNWIGAVNRRMSSYLRYSFLCSRANGINMEENWGFAKMYDWEYRYGTTPLYQSMLAIASGSTGYNVYTAVGTSSWSEKLDTHHKVPYPSNSPISEEGKLTNKYYLMAGLNAFFGEYYGREFFECGRDTLVTIGLYQPYAQMAAFTGGYPKIWSKLGVTGPPSFGEDFLQQVHVTLQRVKIAYQIVNLETFQLSVSDHPEDAHLQKALKARKIPRVLVFAASSFLEQKIQQKLVNYVSQGGILYLIGEIPEFDAHWNPCSVMKDGLHIGTKGRPLPKKESTGKIYPVGQGMVIFQKGNPYRASRGVKYFAFHILAKILSKLTFKVPKLPPIMGRQFPFHLIYEMLGGDFLVPQPRAHTLKSANRLIRFLQTKNIHRMCDVVMRTEHRFRHQLDHYLYFHPDRDLQYLFIFSVQCPRNLRVSFNYYLPELDRRVHIKTTLVGNTAMLLRIEEGKLTALVYMGVNPISRLFAPLYLKINGHKWTTEKPIDLIMLDPERKGKIFTAHGQFKTSTTLHGLKSGPLQLVKKGNIDLSQD